MNFYLIFRKNCTSNSYHNTLYTMTTRSHKIFDYYVDTQNQGCGSTSIIMWIWVWIQDPKNALMDPDPNQNPRETKEKNYTKNFN